MTTSSGRRMRDKNSPRGGCVPKEGKNGDGLAPPKVGGGVVGFFLVLCCLAEAYVSPNK